MNHLINLSLALSVIVNAALIAWNLGAHYRHRNCRKRLHEVRLERDEARRINNAMMRVRVPS